jgi:uncharacterized OsmC-like protein
MSVQSHIRESVQEVISYYTQNPDDALSLDKEAVAVIEYGLRARAIGPDGQTLVCDMPQALGGEAAAPTPGWVMRAALANCEAIMIALRAAQLGVELTALDMRVDTLSDDRGMLGMDDSKPAGPLNMKIRIRIGTKEASQKKLHEIVEWAEAHSPVGEPLTRIMPVEYAVEIVQSQRPEKVDGRS